MNNKTKIIIGFLIIIVLILIVVWYGVSRKSTTFITKEPIKIGAILPLTGPGSNLGIALKEGLEWKIEELKNQGEQIEFLIEDSQSNPKEAVSSFNKLVNINKVRIIFTILSSSGMSLKPLAEKNKVLLWADVTHPEMTKNSNYILRHSNTADNDAKGISEHIIQQGFKKIGILYQMDEWGIAFNNLLINKLTKNNIKVDSEAIDHKASDFRTEISKIKNKKPDGIVLIAFGPASGILIKQIKELNYKGLLYSSIGFILTPDAQNIAKDYSKGMYYQTYEENFKFISDYKKRFQKEPSLISLLGYTDIELLYFAISQTKSTEPEKIIKYIKELKEFQGKYEKVFIEPTGDIIIPTIIKIWE